MKSSFGMRVLGAAMMGVLAVYVTGCNRAANNATEPTATTTVGTEIDDGVLTTRIRAALLEDADVKSYDLKVESRKGEVLLSGFVDSQLQMDRAMALTRAIAGVKAIDNKMRLKGAATTIGDKVDDGIITTRVKAALLADANIKSLDIAVNTRKGEVRLSGFVNNQGQIDRALALAHGIEGVSSVGNEMRIKK